MKKTKKIVLRRSSDFSGGGFGFTLRHFVIYPPSVSVNDILRASYSVVIDEHQQKQLESGGVGGGGAATSISSSSLSTTVPSNVVSSTSSNSLIHHQGEQQRSSSSMMKNIGNDYIQDDGTTLTNNSNLNIQSTDTIFVKEVRPDGPAYAAGLRQGDQLLTVNDQSIHGKSYSQVIAMIQNTSADLVLNVLSKEDQTQSINSTENVYSNSNLNESRMKPIQYPRTSSYQSVANLANNKNSIEQKLRNLQLNIAQGRTQEELAQIGIYLPPPIPTTTTTTTTTSSSQSQQANVFSNYIDSVHRALDSSKQQQQQQQSKNMYFENPYENDFQFDYKKSASTFPINFNQISLTNLSRPAVPPRQNIPLPNTLINVSTNRFPLETWSNQNSYDNGLATVECDEDLKSPSTENSSRIESPSHDKLDNDMKTEFVNFRKKQFETGHVENLVRDPQRESKTKKYSEKKKYENEWTRLTAVADLESVMERASHFEDIDPDKYARLKSKLPNSPPLQQSNSQENFSYDFNQNHLNSQFKTNQRQTSFDASSSTFNFPKAGDVNSIEFNFEPRFLLNQSQFHPTLPSNQQKYQLENYQRNSSNKPSMNLIRQPSYITAVRTNEQTDFVSQFGNSREKTDDNIKSSYLINNQQDFYHQNPYPINQQQTQKIRNSSEHQSQAMKKLKSFFSESLPSSSSLLINDNDAMSPPSSSGGRSKSGSIFDGTLNNQERIRLTTMTDNIEAAKEGILYCKMVLKEGRRATDRSWRGAWAVLRHGALFLGKEKKHGLLIPLSIDSFPINLQNADVELASDYIKKPRVFKLTTANQSEFLFQAPDLQSLNEWLDLLNEHCISSESQQDNQFLKTNNQQRKSTTSLPPIVPQQELSTNNQSRKSKSKLSLRSPSLKRSPSLRFRKSQKSSITQPAQLPPQSPPSSINETHSSTTQRRSFVKSIVKKGLRTLKSSSSLLTNQMSGQIYDESSQDHLSTNNQTNEFEHGTNFAIELEECESSSISRFIPIVVEILTRLIELRAINCQGIYRHAGGLSVVNYLVQQLDKGSENIDFNSEKWYDVKAVASTLKTFFAKLPDSLLSSNLSSLAVESSRNENHCERLIQLKKILFQLDNFRYETLKYLCAHFRRVSAKCHINKIDARNLAIIFGPTLIWDSKASLQSNLVDNPEKIRIIESFILYYEWFFEDESYERIPSEINPQMPRLPAIPNQFETNLNTETKPGDIIEHIVRAAKGRWSSSLFIPSLSSMNSQQTTNDQQTPKSINISLKRYFKQIIRLVSVV